MSELTVYSGAKIQKSIKEGILYGNRIPRDFFVTSGTGESNITIHAGSYHLALKAARIEMCNIITYSSILPGIANLTERPEKIQHGSVMESIMSVCHARKGELATAGIIYSWLHDRETGARYGGLVCEHEGNYDKTELVGRLNASLEELFQNGYADRFYLDEKQIISESFIPRKNYGTALVALCFTSYYYPVFDT